MQTQIHTTLLTAVIFIASLITDHSATAQEIWGMTKHGGEYHKGVIFKMDENASGQEVVYSFETIQGPAGGLTEYKNNLFYGLSSGGGKYKKGVLYKFDLSSGRFSHIKDLDGENTGSYGRDRMLLASNGKFYGTTNRGGAYDMGILFVFDPETNRFEKLMDFEGSNYGSHPSGGLMEGVDTELYGTTETGGIHDDGILFSYNTLTGKYTKLFDFSREDSGAGPVGKLVRNSDGTLYGITREGGDNDDGVIFRYDPATGLTTVVFEFNGSITGRNPKTGLKQTSNGKLYGITITGGPTDKGGVFEFNPEDNGYNLNSDLIGFEFSENLIAASDDKLYFMAEGGFHVPPGITVYDPETDEIFWRGSALHSSREMDIYYNSLMEASNGKLYFLANSTQNDIRNENILYEVDIENNEFSNYFKFSGVKNGEFPYGSLYQADNGMVYGTTYIGGDFHQGVVFKIDPSTYEVEKIVDFERLAHGAHPTGSVIEANNNKLYGFTSEGGEFNIGIIYEVDPHSRVFKKIVDFNGPNGTNPDGDLVKAPNGMLYGVTSKGGAFDMGVFFQVDPGKGEFKKLLDFDGSSLGSYPYIHALVAFPNGVVYGTTQSGGSFGHGILFVFNPVTGIVRKAMDFRNEVTGSTPTNFVLGNDNKLYYLSETGLVKFDPTNLSFVNALADNYHQFTTLTSKLLLSTNGKFYAMDKGYIWYRAIDFPGGIHEFDYNNGDTRHVLEFNWQNGSNPENTSLIQLRNTTAPVASCRDITLYLDENGQAILEPQDIDAGSTGDNIQLSVDVSEFGCDDTGENLVKLTVTDADGNISECEATVTVIDNIPPEVNCQVNHTAQLEPYQNSFVIEGTLLDAMASDNCEVESLTFQADGLDGPVNTSLDGFVLHAGTFDFTWTATDRSGNIEVCTSEIIIEKRPTSLTILRNEVDNDIPTLYLEVALTDNILNGGIEGKTIVFSGEGFMETAVTTADGVAVLSVDLDEEPIDGYMITALFEEDDTYTGSSSEAEIITDVGVTAWAGIQVYPNPFTHKIYFEFVAPVATDARIDVYDPLGRLVKNIFRQPVESGRYYRVEYKPQFVTESHLLYRLELGKLQYNGKVMYKKQR